MIILNIAAGKIKPIIGFPNNNVIINVDTSYYYYDDPIYVEDRIKHFKENGIFRNEEIFCNEDIFTFMERTKIIFDKICIYRFLEHVPMDKVLYFIYLLSTVINKKQCVDIIVPNYERLAMMILNENPSSKDFDSHNITLTTELLNEPSCPHASIWTIGRAKYFFELEKRFEITDYYPNFQFDGRDIYLRFTAKRV